MDGIYGPKTAEAVAAVQNLFGLEQTGSVDRQTLFAVYDIYLGVADVIRETDVTTAAQYGGQLLAVGSTGGDVSILQSYINVLSGVYDTITPPEITGTYDAATEAAVSEIQRIFGITVTGITGPITWDTIASEYELIADGDRFTSGQYGGDIYNTEAGA